MVIRGRRIITILLVQVLEFVVSEVDASHARSVACFGRCNVQSHDHAPGQMLTVQPERFWREDISDDHLEPVLVKTASKPAGILHAQALLRHAFGTIPWRGSSRDHELAQVVHVDDSSASASAGNKTGRRALAHRRTSRQH